MTAQPTPPELDAHRHRKDWRDIAERWPDQAWSSEAVLALLDALTRAEAQSAIRGRAVVMYRDRAREAEAERDQAYEWADDQSHPLVMRQGEILTGVANALNGPTPPRTSWSHHDLAEKAAAMVARAEQAEAERDEWRQTALDERAAALDALEQIKAREARIKAVQDVLDQKDADLDAMSNPPREHRGVLMADIRRALDGAT